MSDEPTKPILRPNGVPLVPRTTAHRPLAPSQALTSMQEKRVIDLIQKAVMRLEKVMGERIAEALSAITTPAPAPVPAAPVPAQPAPAPVPAAPISAEATELINKAKSADLKRALMGIARRDIPEEVKLKQMAAALKKHEP